MVSGRRPLARDDEQILYDQSSDEEMAERDAEDVDSDGCKREFDDDETEFVEEYSELKREMEEFLVEDEEFENEMLDKQRYEEEGELYDRDFGRELRRKQEEMVQEGNMYLSGRRQLIPRIRELAPENCNDSKAVPLMGLKLPLRIPPKKKNSTLPGEETKREADADNKQEVAIRVLKEAHGSTSTKKDLLVKL